MKSISVIIVVVVLLGLYWLIKLNTKDNQARKDAVKVTATVTKLRCKQRLKGDKSLLVVTYQTKDYSIFLSEKRCFQFSENQEISVFYSKTYDKLFLEK